MTTPAKHRGAALAAAVSVLGLLLGGCQGQAVQPRTHVTCTPGRISIEVTNLSTKPARYTVSVDIERAGDTDTEQYSSNRIDAGASGTITDRLPDEQAQCRVSAVQVFDA